jgi:hypothetical protein
VADAAQFSGKHKRRCQVSPGLVVADPLKVYVAGTPIRDFPATFPDDHSFTVLERHSGHVFRLTPVADTRSFIIHCPPPLDFRKEHIYPMPGMTSLTQVKLA